MAFTPGTAAQPTSEVELSISARGLLRMDYFSKSDPMCVTYFKPFGEDRWVELHRTETITDCHDPDFSKKIHIIYKFEEQQPLLFKLYDIDSSSTRLEDHHFLGYASCSLAQIIHSGKVQLPLTIKQVGESKNGHLIVSAEELGCVKDEVVMKLAGRRLDRKSYCLIFGKCDPFLEIFKSTETGSYVLVHRTEVINNSVNPNFREIAISSRTLCNGDYDRSLKIVCLNWNRGGDHSFVGECYVTVKEMLDESSPRLFKFVNKRKQSPESGELVVERCLVKPTYTFMDYLKGGTQIHCTFSIDFTASNGDPNQPDSLHYIHSSQLNYYEQAITAVGNIIEDYDSDKQFPVLGFGARLPPDARVSHEFYVNFNPNNPYCSRIDGVLTAYRSCIRRVQLFGPTNFAPSINHVAKFAQAYQDGSAYFILLIITDGIITDMPQTCNAIVHASTLPLSIIIVGVGNADFSAMEELDGDTVAVTSGGRKAARDIVQFVPLNKFINSRANMSTVRQLLAREVLAEIPGQFVSFMKSKGIKPNPPLESVLNLPADPDLAII